ncbi:TetR family transcriptional regulator [Lapillicoccus sp.]|uniref:TetR family transcriptional regulator n=1 Tax=Lapillicoccus sp. TaxID=1909287 RepID=UPI002600A119|nr:TetR family transcriptional regulator [Lapillicoccus sp.]
MTDSRSEVTTGSGTTVVPFVRARTPEHKALRREAILDAARALALDRGVRGVTLGDLADEVGLAKSNVVRYFGTREEIFVELSTRESVVVRDVLLRRLEDASPATVPTIVATTIAEHELFCELVSQLTTHLEHHVSFGAAERLKLGMHAVVADLIEALVRVCPGLSADGAALFVNAATLVTSGLWAASRPSDTLREVYAAHPELPQLDTGIASQVEQILAALLRGLLADPAPTA